jgi:acyl-CoA thioesterase I
MINSKLVLRFVASSVVAALLAGCAGLRTPQLSRQFGESVVCIGEEPAALAWIPARGKPLTVRSSYLPGSNTIHFVEGRDFVVDYAAGTLRRTPGSRLPDFRSNVLYGKADFNHTQFPGFGNGGHFVFVDYSFVPTTPWPVQSSQNHLLRSTQGRLKAGQPVKIVAFGDSITAGGDATTPELIFWRRWTAELQRRYPGAAVTAVNGATGGDNTVQGLQRLANKVLAEKPDLVLVGFGMNDHNVSGVPIPQFAQNLKELISRIRSETGAEIILFSAFPPNPQWKFGSHRMEQYAAATAGVATETGCAYADVYSNWETIARRKKPEDLLGNNINHPNDFGHWVYFQVLEKLGL